MEYGYPHIQQRIQLPEYEVALGLEPYWAASFLAEAETRDLPLPDIAWREAETQTFVRDLCTDLQSGWAEILSASYETLQQIGDTEAAAHTLWLLGLAMDRQGRFTVVADRLAREMTALAPDGAAAEALLRVGILFRRNGILDKAERFLRRSLHGWERVPGRETRHAETRIALGDLLVMLDRREEALEQYTLALEELERYRQAVLERTGLDNYDIRFNIGSANLALGKFYLTEGDARSLERAAHHAETALNTMQAEGVIDHWGVSLTLLGQVRQRQSRLDEAAELYRQACELGTERLLSGVSHEPISLRKICPSHR